MSPLHMAAATGQTQVVLDIIKEEGKIDKYFGIVNKDLGGKNANLLRSPLHYAVRGGYFSVCNTSLACEHYGCGFKWTLQICK